MTQRCCACARIEPKPDIHHLAGAAFQFIAEPFTLRITAPMTFGVKWFNRLLCEYLQRHSELDAEVLYTDEVVGLVEANVDVAIRIGALEDSSLIGRRLAPVELITVASPAYLEAPRYADASRRPARAFLLSLQLSSGRDHLAVSPR